jgi:hypothetical protein
MLVRVLAVATGFSALLLAACASAKSQPAAQDATPPPQIQAWMNRLTVAHAYDPKTGFIVARETVPLPAALTQRSIDAAIAQARADPCLEYIPRIRTICRRIAVSDGELVDGLGGIAEHRETDSSMGVRGEACQQFDDHLGANTRQILKLVDDHMPDCGKALVNHLITCVRNRACG